MVAPGMLVGSRYRLRNRVGAGGMGVVWEAEDERLQRRVALKMLHRQPGVDDAEAELANRRAMREARITARLHHRHAIAIFDVVEHEGQACLVMPFLPSITLAAALEEGGPLSPREAAQVGEQVASALAAAHEAGIVHRDIKPGNVLITDDGTALISDFGIAHALGDTTITTTGVVHGTPAYLAPEVARGLDATPASDVFSLGATLYAALEGQPPFGSEQNSMALLLRIATSEPDPPTRSGALTPLLEEMLSTDPDRRPPMHAVAQRLGQLRSELTGTRVEPPPAREVSSAESSSGGRRRAAAILGAVAAVLLIALVAVLWASRRPSEVVAGPGAPVTTTAPAPSTTTASPTTSASPATSASPGSSVNPSRTRSPSPADSSASASAATPSPTRTSVEGRPSASELARAIREYYALMPEGTDQGWTRMTSGYRTSHAGGRQSYESFWGAIRRVSTSDITGRPPDRAEATITYRYRDGRVVRERTAYRLVNDGGTLKIDDSTVLSSTTT